MQGLLEKFPVASPKRRSHVAAKAAINCEALEDRKLLSSDVGFSGGVGHGGPRAAEMGFFGAGRQGGLFGGGSLGLGGGMRNPTLLLTAPLLDGGNGSMTPPSPSVFSSSGVQQALQTLQTDLKNDIPSAAKPTHASIGALQDDLQAIRAGTLSGTDAQTEIQADQAGILTSMGLTSAQVTQIQADQQCLQTAISSASTATSSSSTSSSSTSTTSTDATTSATSSTSPTSTVQSAFSTLETDLKNDTPSGGRATHESIGAVQDDLDAIRNGTLTGSAAVTQVQTDTAAVLSSMGLTSAQVTQVQADQAALETAIQANSSSATSTTSSSSTESTLQSVSEYLVGLPGLSGIGMRGAGGIGMGGARGFGMGAGGGGAGSFGGWRVRVLGPTQGIGAAIPWVSTPSLIRQRPRRHSN